MRSRPPMILAVVCALLAAALGLAVAGDHGPTGADAAVRDAVAGLPHGLLRLLVLPTEPYVLLPALALPVVWCLHRSRPWDAVFAALGPAFAVAANTWLLKPLFDRWKGGTLVYPSGHTVAMVSAVVVVAVLVHGRARVLIAAAGAVLFAGVSVGMVGLGYHYVTDVAGGTAFAVAAVLAVRAGAHGRGPRRRVTPPRASGRDDSG
jgi:membrane-associated phospholipid phosphatase